MSALINKLTALPPVYFLQCLAVGLFLHYGFGRIWRVQVPWPRTIALLIFGAAGGMALWGRLELRRYRTAWHPWGTPSAMVTTGPYAFSRNPMYLSLLLCLLAAVWWYGSPLLLSAPVLFVVGMNAGRIREEERVLGECFRENFSGYCRKVRRWI